MKISKTCKPDQVTCISAGQLEMIFPLIVVTLNSSSAVPMATPLISYTELWASCSDENDDKESFEAFLRGVRERN